MTSQVVNPNERLEALFDSEFVKPLTMHVMGNVPEEITSVPVVLITSKGL
jgi:hypothetical protein